MTTSSTPTPKKERPKEPARSLGFPTKWELALHLLNQFREHHDSVTVKCVLADALYGHAAFVNLASSIFGGVQVITQLGTSGRSLPPDATEPTGQPKAQATRVYRWKYDQFC
ncbi:MAG: transposase [Magnetococcales bacterium]|nr:transposase [Magnetococcales bacterium]